MTVTLDSGQSSAPGAAARITYYPTSTGGAAKPQVDGVNLPGGNNAGGMHVEIYGAGFSSDTGTPTVTFGGVAAGGVTVIDDNHLTAVDPPYGSKTACVTKADPATDVCQTEVQITTSQGSSALSKIRPEFVRSSREPGLCPARAACPPPPSSTTSPPDDRVDQRRHRPRRPVQPGDDHRDGARRARL